jgi:hypothetical protein
MIGGGPYLGPVTARDTSGGGLDAELIHSPSSAFGSTIYVGATSSNSKRTLIGAGPTQPGSIVCVSGAYEGERCSTVAANPACFTIAEYEYHPHVGPRYLCQMVYTFSSIKDTFGAGDSGAPVYQYFGSTVKAVGIGSALDRFSPHIGSCSNWSAQLVRACGSNYWFVAIAPILVKWGLSVL